MCARGSNEIYIYVVAGMQLGGLIEREAAGKQAERERDRWMDRHADRHTETCRYTETSEC